MKKITVLALFLIFLGGCASYKFQRGEKPYDGGYVVNRSGMVITEYTLGKDNSVPDDLELARERFKRRRDRVGYYYRKSGEIESVFRSYLWNPCAMLLELISGPFRLPFIALSDRKYNRDPKYREKVIKAEEEKEAREENRIGKIKAELNAYIQKDLVSETTGQAVQQKEQAIIKTTPEQPKKELTAAPPATVSKPAAATDTATEEQLPEETSPVVITKEETPPKIIPPPPTAKTITANIIAKPAKGYSPLSVRFSASKSYTDKKSKIIYYHWDFGDGDTSNKIKPVNTYYSGTLKPRDFQVTLTVQDDKGNTAKTNTVIQVLNK